VVGLVGRRGGGSEGGWGGSGLGRGGGGRAGRSGRGGRGRAARAGGAGTGAGAAGEGGAGANAAGAGGAGAGAARAGGAGAGAARAGAAGAGSTGGAIDGGQRPPVALLFGGTQGPPGPRNLAHGGAPDEARKGVLVLVPVRRKIARTGHFGGGGTTRSSSVLRVGAGRNGCPPCGRQVSVRQSSNRFRSSSTRPIDHDLTLSDRSGPLCEDATPLEDHEFAWAVWGRELTPWGGGRCPRLRPPAGP